MTRRTISGGMNVFASPRMTTAIVCKNLEETGRSASKRRLKSKEIDGEEMKTGNTPVRGEKEKRYDHQKTKRRGEI